MSDLPLKVEVCLGLRHGSSVPGADYCSAIGPAVKRCLELHSITSSARVSRVGEQGPAPARLAQQYKPFISRGDPIENQSFVSSGEGVFILAFSFPGFDSIPGVILAKHQPKFPTALRGLLAEPLLEPDR